MPRGAEQTRYTGNVPRIRESPLPQCCRQKGPFNSSLLCTAPSRVGGELGKAARTWFFSFSVATAVALRFSIKKWKKTVTEMLGSSTERELAILGAVPPGSRNSVCPIPWHPDCSWHLCLDTARAFSTSPLSRQAWSGLLHPRHRLPRAPRNRWPGDPFLIAS